MNKEAKEILLLIEKELIENKDIRFTQALFALGINQFADKEDPCKKDYMFRDNYNDNDSVVLDRIKTREKLKEPESKKEINYDVEIVRNRAKCLHCNDIITSYHGHDYVTCLCGKISVDGGNQYLKRSFDKPTDYEDLSVYSNAPFEEIRENFHRGGRGKDGTMPLTWTALCDMNDEWLAACILYNEERGSGDSFANKMYRKELDYRKENNILIKENEN
jgi:hypothetical protein